jgi:hypothetical protein
VGRGFDHATFGTAPGELPVLLEGHSQAAPAGVDRRMRLYPFSHCNEASLRGTFVGNNYQHSPRRIDMVSNVAPSAISSLLACLAACMLLSVAPASAENTPSTWPTWHGLNRDGKSPETGLLKAWPEGGPQKLWAVTNGLGYGESSVSIYDGLIYATGLQHEGTNYSEAFGNIWLTALDMDGKIKWSKDVGPAYVGNHVYQGARATPTCDDGNVYLLRCLGTLGCFDA